MPINTLMYIYIYFHHMLHPSYGTGNTGRYRQDWNNGTDTDSHTGNVHSNSCSPWGYICTFLEVWMFLSCFYFPWKYQVLQNLASDMGTSCNFCGIRIMCSFCHSGSSPGQLYPIYPYSSVPHSQSTHRSLKLLLKWLHFIAWSCNKLGVFANRVTSAARFLDAETLLL